MKTFPSAFYNTAQRRLGATPVWILKCLWADDSTQYLSDRIVTVADWNSETITTVPWVNSWGGIDENIVFGAGKSILSQYTISVLIDPQRRPNIHEILWNEDNNIEVSDCELYLWFEGLNASTNPPQKVWSGNITDFKRVSTLKYDLYLVDALVKLNKICAGVVTATDYALAPKRSIGRVKPIIYGQAKKVPAVCIVSGGVSTLASNITSTGTSITLVDGSSFPSGAHSIQIEGEVISVTSRTGNVLAVSRSNGWTHTAGALVVQHGLSFVYLIADHPVNSIDNVYIDGIEITDGVTKYTGKTGNAHASYPGKAVVVLTHGTDYVEQEFRPSDSDTTTVGSGMTIDPADYMVDGNGATASVVTDIYGSGDSVSYNARFSNINIFGLVVQQKTKNSWSAIPTNAGGITFRITIGTTAVYAVNTGGTTNTGNRVEHTTTAQLNPRIYVSQWGQGYGSTGAGGFQAIECWSKTVCYWKYRTSGESADQIVIGNNVSCSVKGWESDGNYGTSGTVIEQPDYIVKHILAQYLDTTSFYTNGNTQYGTLQYLMNVVISDNTPIADILGRIAFQCRSWFRFYAGTGQLLFRTDTFSEQRIIDLDQIVEGSFTLERSPLNEVINKIDARYLRDWSLSGDDAYESLYATTDAGSIVKYGEKSLAELSKLDYIRTETMAGSVCDFYLAKYKDRHKTLNFHVLLDNADLEFNDHLIVSLLAEPIFGGGGLGEEIPLEEAEMIASGNVAFADFHINLGYRSFVDFGAGNSDLINNVGNYIKIYDSADNCIEGYITEVSSGETYDEDEFYNWGLPNPDFSENTSSWIATNASLSSVAGGQSGNCLSVECTAGDSQMARNESLNSSSDTLYLLSVYVKSGTAGNGAFVIQIPYGEGGGYHSVSGVSSGGWTQYTFYHIDMGLYSTVIRLVKNNNAVGTMLFDTVRHFRVLSPSANGVFITNVRGGGDDEWSSISGSFNLQDTEYTYEIYDTGGLLPDVIEETVNVEVEKVNFQPTRSTIEIKAKEFG